MGWNDNIIESVRLFCFDLANGRSSLQPSSPLLVMFLFRLQVHRENLLEEAFRKVMSAQRKELQRHKLFISFIGEEGLDYRWDITCYRRLIVVVVVVLPDPFRGMGAWRNSTETNSRAMPQGLDQRSKMEEVVPKMARRRGSDAGQSRRR